jgi:hypothetical protein
MAPPENSHQISASGGDRSASGCHSTSIRSHNAQDYAISFGAHRVEMGLVEVDNDSRD